jgi:hypothetical protein
MNHLIDKTQTTSDGAFRETLKYSMRTGECVEARAQLDCKLVADLAP